MHLLNCEKSELIAILEQCDCAKSVSPPERSVSDELPYMATAMLFNTLTIRRTHTHTHTHTHSLPLEAGALKLEP